MTVLFNKPFGVLSQFTGDQGQKTLAAFHLPKQVYAAGRLDKDSEGLLLLTGDGQLKHALMDPQFGHSRTYLVQVERVPSQDVLEQLARGIVLDGKPTKPAKVKLLRTPPVVAERVPPIRFRKTVPTAWLELELTEGRNRQVRRMTAGIGHPALRLIRTRILFFSLEGLGPGQWRPIIHKELQQLRRAVGL